MVGYCHNVHYLGSTQWVTLLIRFFDLICLITVPDTKRKRAMPDANIVIEYKVLGRKSRYSWMKDGDNFASESWYGIGFY